MQTGAKISGAVHVGLILVVLFAGSFESDPLPFEMASATVVSAEEYAALVSGEKQPEVSETPEAPAEAEQPAAAPEEPPAEPEPEPEVAEAEPEPEPEPTPAPEVAPAPVEPQVRPQPDKPDVVEAPVEQPEETAAPKAERIAPEIVETPPPDAKPDEVKQAEVVPDEGAATPQEPKEETAPKEATDRIEPEQKPNLALAPQQSVRPSVRPTRPAPVETAAAPEARETPEPKPVEKPVEKPAEKPKPVQEAKTEPKPEPKPEAKPVDTSSAVNDALAEALGGEKSASPAPSGPPLTSGEKDALRIAVQRCWNVGSLSSEALKTTVVVNVTMSQDGRPDTGTIRMVSSSGGTGGSAQQAFEAARRAIIRCGASGFDLPADKYAQWREIEMTFNPERMRIR
ncbi:energy transducer TonB [Albibacillus kandeliae]|uniref:energy transducer TonB n=1 Tax=Albibacillus kandeliae TaxID=2174228 RepID=UPI000D68ADF2|nr:energy transducer TonB [Albibacillus kandeliae]